MAVKRGKAILAAGLAGVVVIALSTLRPPAAFAADDVRLSRRRPATLDKQGSFDRPTRRMTNKAKTKKEVTR